MVCLHDLQAQQFPLKAHILGEPFEALDCCGVDLRDPDLNFRLSRLPSAHLIPADNAAVANEGYAVTALLHFAQQMRVQEDSRATIALLADHVAHQLASGGIEAGGGLVEKE